MLDLLTIERIIGVEAACLLTTISRSLGPKITSNLAVGYERISGLGSFAVASCTLFAQNIEAYVRMDITPKPCSG